MASVRRFDGAGDRITCALGSYVNGASTLAVVVKRGADGVWGALMTVHTGTTGNVLAFEVRDSNALTANYDGSGSVAGFGITVAEGWCLLAATKATGTVAPRFHKCVLSTGVWTHGVGDTARADPAVSPVDWYFGEWGDGNDDLNGDLACAGYWASDLSDGAVEALAPGIQAWIAAGPAAVWKFDQDLTTTPVQDLAGAANETALAGTSVVTDSPTNFDLSVSSPPVLEEGPATAEGRSNMRLG